VLQATVYLLCLAASVGCALLLARSYRRNRTRLLLWSAACFLLLAVNNFLVVMDILVLPAMDFIPLRRLASLSAVAVLLFGFIWESD
jgi:Family of unknown function (DUF5985)